MDKEQAIHTAERFAERVAKEFNPRQILLFGSYLDGTFRENSDIDVAVVFDKDSEPENWLKAASRMQTIRREIKASKIEPHLMELDNGSDSFAHHVQEVGKVLYER
ncbi:MAG: nucleotidyltransferase domain-containing protein [Chitinispirillales bacterium]|jgi:predicted nucleotidyltransferase|nr:nucleotidyltransferase domain-containing protein [Chitinispirillales bacterium]